MLQVYLIECQHGSDDVEDEDLVQSSGSGDEYFAPVTSKYTLPFEMILFKATYYGSQIFENLWKKMIE